MKFWKLMEVNTNRNSSNLIIHKHIFRCRNIYSKYSVKSYPTKSFYEYFGTLFPLHLDFMKHKLKARAPLYKRKKGRDIAKLYNT